MRDRRSRAELRFLLAAGVTGALLETAMTSAGVYTLPRGLIGGVVWLGALWFAFAATLARGLRWVAESPAVGTALGLVGGPLSFLAGERLGAVVLGEPLALRFRVVPVAEPFSGRSFGGRRDGL